MNFSMIVFNDVKMAKKDFYDAKKAIPLIWSI